MKTLIIGRKNFGEKNDIAVLSNKLQALSGDASFEHAYFEDLIFIIKNAPHIPQILVSNDGGFTPLESYGLLIMLHWTGDRVFGDIAFTAALYAESHGMKVWNTELLQSRSTTKLSQLMRMALAGEYGAPAVFALDHKLLAEQVQAADLFPGVCKDVSASRGRSNYLVEDKTILAHILQSSSDKPMIVQALIPNDGSDLRFFVTGSKVGLVIRRKGSAGVKDSLSSAVSHLNNVSAGGSAELVEPNTFDPLLIQEVERVALVFGRELCGIDYIFDTQRQKYIFLEINGTPQIVNGVFTDEKIQTIANSINTLR
jgi:glutathione synthase/RimK-type ligase-like ATP-grasp enzyme